MIVLKNTNPFFNGKPVLFKVNFDLQWFWFEMVAFAFVGIVGGTLVRLVTRSPPNELVLFRLMSPLKKRGEQNPGPFSLCIFRAICSFGSTCIGR